MIAIVLLGLFQTISLLTEVTDSIRVAQDILHYDVNLAFPERGDVVRAAVGVRYMVQGERGPLRLDFDDRLAIDSIMLGGRTGLQYTDWWWGGFAENPVLEIDHWGIPGDTLSVTVCYHGTPSDGLVIRDNIHGKRTVFSDNWASRAHFWLPSEDHPSDKATVNFAVEVPRGWRVVANGLLRGVDSLHDGRSVWQWYEAQPIPVHTMVVGAGVMSVTTLKEFAAVPQSVWTFPEDSALAVEQGPFRRAVQMVAILSDIIGPYPYEKLAHVQSSTRFGGMENSSVIFYNERAIAFGSLGEETVAHEIAHQWFGDAVSQRDWHHLWLSEGFATYFGSLFFQLVGEGESFTTAMRAGKQRCMNSPMVESPVIDTTLHDPLELLNTNNYYKGAWVLHMLRAELGDSLFFKGIREYYETYRDSTALTGDFMAIIAKYAGRSMDWFFEQWLLRPGFPRLQVVWRHDVDQGRVKIQVKQIQLRDWGDFTFSLPVLIRYEDGNTIRVTLLIEGRDTVHEITTAASPSELVLDPAESLLIDVVRVTRGS